MMFLAVKKLIKETIGVAGLAEQLRHQCSKGTNVLMRSSGDPEVFREVSNTEVEGAPVFLRAPAMSPIVNFTGNTSGDKIKHILA